MHRSCKIFSFVVLYQLFCLEDIYVWVPITSEKELSKGLLETIFKGDLVIYIQILKLNAIVLKNVTHLCM